MFDIGFSEILLISVLALVVLGPEKLPKVVAQLGRWIGRARGMARQFREQLEEEGNLEEKRRSQPAVSRSTPPPSPAAQSQTEVRPTVASAEPVPHSVNADPNAATLVDPAPAPT